MQISPLRQVNAPSSQLLKYLRAQNRAFTSITRPCTAITQSRPRYSRHQDNHAHVSRVTGIARASRHRANSTATHTSCLAKNSPRRDATSGHITPTSQPLIPSESFLTFFDRFWPCKKSTHDNGEYTRTDYDPIPSHASRYTATPSHLDRSFSILRPHRQYEQTLNSARLLSTSTQPHAERRFFRHLWPSKESRHKSSLQPNDLPPLSNGPDDGANLGRLLRPANELMLRCTEFDENGNVTVNGDFKKSELIAKYGLNPRDLRKIDSSLLPNILIRPTAILINLLHLRVLIKENRVLVFDAYGTTNSYSQSLFMYDLEQKLRTASLTSPATPLAHALPYEFRALEAVLISVTSGLESEFDGVREPVVRVLRELEEDIDRDKLRHLLIYSKKLGTFEQKARLVRDEIDALLESDEDLTDMYLTDKASGIERTEDEHTEVEMLLESYHKVCDEIVQAAGNLVSNIWNTEEIVKAILDANRNSLMLLDLKFSIGTLGLGAGTFGAALYGMNLKNFIEENDFGFWAVSGWCTLFSVVVCFWGLRRLRGVQRLSMWGAEKGDEVRGKSGWASLGGVAGERPLELEPLVGPAVGERRRVRSGVAGASVGAGAARKMPWKDGGSGSGGGMREWGGAGGAGHAGNSSASADTPYAQVDTLNPAAIWKTTASSSPISSPTNNSTTEPGNASPRFIDKPIVARAALAAVQDGSTSISSTTPGVEQQSQNQASQEGLFEGEAAPRGQKGSGSTPGEGQARKRKGWRDLLGERQEKARANVNVEGGVK